MSFQQISIKTPTKIRFIERSVFMKDLNNENLWKFKLGSQESMIVPMWIIKGFQHRDRQELQNLNDDTFCRLLVVSSQFLIGTEKYPDTGILLNYDDDDYSQALVNFKQAFRALIKDDIIQPYISDHDFRSPNVRVDHVGYKLYVFDKRYQQKFTASQPVELEFNFDGVFGIDINGYALVLTNELVSISSDG